MKKQAASVIPIRPEAVTPPDPPPARGAMLPPPIGQQHTARERRSSRMLQVVARGNKAESELVDSVAIDSGIPFLEQTQSDICLRFLAGTDERRIAESLSTRHYSVARVDVERVIRAGYRAERSARLAAERQLRLRAA